MAKPKQLSDAIKKLSDYYIENPKGTTPWHLDWAVAAYLTYFFPLNWARTAAAFEEAKRVDFFKGLNSYIDYGSGLSPASFLMSSVGIQKGVCIDQSLEALHLHEEIQASSPLSVRRYRTFNGVTQSGQLGIFSYALTELNSLPEWTTDLDALLIIEPSTREDGRRLLDIRAEFLGKKYFAWAPCLHQNQCPLLHGTKKDWCHHRIDFDGPSWYQEIEKTLPFKNRTITFSYLCLRKKEPKKFPVNYGRIVGDRLDEKGKFKQLMCRGPDREFLSWLKKENDTPFTKRGDVVELPEKMELKSNELRLSRINNIKMARL